MNNSLRADAAVDFEAQDRPFIPSSFQTPNAFVDELMPQLSGAAFKVLMVITRETLGRKDWRPGQMVKMSLSDFGKRTGLGHATVLYALRELKNQDLIVEEKGLRNSRVPNGYALKLDFTTGRLVQKVDQPLGKKTRSKIDQVKNLPSQLGGQRLGQKVDSLKVIKIKNKNKNKSVSASPPHTPLKHKIEDKEASPHREIVKHYHDLFVKNFQFKPKINLADGQMLKAMLAAGRSSEEIKAVLDFYFEYPDDFTRKRGLFALKQVLSANSYTQTLARLRAHEDKTRSY